MIRNEPTGTSTPTRKLPELRTRIPEPQFVPSAGASKSAPPKTMPYAVLSPSDQAQVQERRRAASAFFAGTDTAKQLSTYATPQSEAHKVLKSVKLEQKL